MNDQGQECERSKINETYRGIGFVQEILHVLIIKKRKKKKSVVVDVYRCERRETTLKEVMPNGHNSL